MKSSCKAVLPQVAASAAFHSDVDVCRVIQALSTCLIERWQHEITLLFLPDSRGFNRNQEVIQTQSCVSLAMFIIPNISLRKRMGRYCKGTKHSLNALPPQCFCRFHQPCKCWGFFSITFCPSGTGNGTIYALDYLCFRLVTDEIQMKIKHQRKDSS